jgi:CHAT domain-containing protein
MLVVEKCAQEALLQVVHGVDKEIGCIAAVANLSNITVVHHQAGSTMVKNTAAIMETANIVHLACHGIQDNNNRDLAVWSCTGLVSRSS